MIDFSSVSIISNNKHVPNSLRSKNLEQLRSRDRERVGKTDEFKINFIYIRINVEGGR